MSTKNENKNWNSDVADFSEVEDDSWSITVFKKPDMPMNNVGNEPRKV